MTVSGTGSTLSLYVPNGTYSYVVAVPTGYTSTVTSGTLGVSGSSISVTIVFTVVGLYSLVFHETGLSPGTSWRVAVNGVTYTTTTTTIELTVPSGTYSYVVYAPSGFVATPSSGSVVIGTTSVTVGISFVPGGAGAGHHGIGGKIGGRIGPIGGIGGVARLTRSVFL
jgi:hypothetical protein